MDAEPENRIPASSTNLRRFLPRDVLPHPIPAYGAVLLNSTVPDSVPMAAGGYNVSPIMTSWKVPNTSAFLFLALLLPLLLLFLPRGRGARAVVLAPTGANLTVEGFPHRYLGRIAAAGEGTR